MTCAVCDHRLPERARFCPNCGTPTRVETLDTEERKMVTVLFADLVDSTTLARRLDAELAREVLGRFFDEASNELRALRGQPEKFVGDAVMAVFGLSQIHEDDALRAVRAALGIRERVRRMGEALGLGVPLEVHIGIESGEAATGLGPTGQLLVTGPVVNAAARLQAAAEPDEVLAGPTTVALTSMSVSYGERRLVPAKGFEAGLPASPVERVTPRSARRAIPFVGRTSELAIVRECLSRTRTIGRPVLVTVLGEPGIGKSRLADELVANLGNDVRVVTGEVRRFTDTATFAPAAAIVADLAGLDEGDPPERTRRRLHELVARSVPADVDRTAERLSLLFGMAERRHESAFVSDVQAAFLALIDGMAREQPLVVVFDDAHTFRPPMLELIERLGARPRTGPRRALVLALARNQLLERRPAWGTSTENAVLLRLDPLSNTESIDLARQAAGVRIGDAEAATIAARADGNPFFIVEITGMLLSEDRGEPATGRPTPPPTVQAVVSARLDHLEPRLRELARRASTFFASFKLTELRMVDPDATEDEVRRLQEAEIFVLDERSRTKHWRIRHTTVKDVAYASLPKRERVRLHRLVADALMAEGHATWAAEHLELAAVASLDLDPDDRSVAELAADALLASGDRARRRLESRSAIHRYEHALGLSGPEERWGAREAKALAGIGEARYWLGEYAAATEALDRAVELGRRTEDPFCLVLALRFLGDIAINVEGDLGKAERLLAESLAIAERLGDPWTISRTLLFAGWVPWNRRRYDEAEKIFRRALEVADPEDGWARARALNSLSVNVPNERAEEALALSEEAMAAAEEIGDQFSIAITTVQMGRVLEVLRRYDESLDRLDTGIAVFEDLGARWELADALAERGEVRRLVGRLDDAEEDLRTAIRISEEIGAPSRWMWRAFADVAKARGDHAEAERRIRRFQEPEATSVVGHVRSLGARPQLDP